jgi:hypothetical protein
VIERLRYPAIQSGLLLFWATWTSLVLLTNVLEALKHAGVLPPDFRLVSGNFTQVSATTAAQGIPAELNIVLFAGVLLWEGTAARLLWGAWSDFRKHGNGTSPVVERAFVVSLALWAAFLLADEALVAYAVAGTHMRILVAQMVTLLVVRGVGADRPVTSSEGDRSGAAG